MEADLVHKSLNGDKDAFGSLVRAYSEEVYAIAMAITGDPTDAEDLTQEVFIKAYLNLGQLKQPDSFGAWLRRIARNHCKDWLRTHLEQYLPLDDIYVQQQLTFPAADERILSGDFGKAFASALSSLKPDDEQILRLFYVHGFKYDEITRANGISYSAATSRLHKAKKRIKALIDGHIPPSEIGSTVMALSGGVENLELGLSNDILNGIKMVERAQSTETEKRRFLCGVNLEYTQKDGLRLIATDGKRLAVAQLPGDGDGEDMSITIPTEELGILKEMLGQESAVVSAERIDENLAAFYIDDTKKLIKLDSGTFPDYRAVISRPKIYTRSVTIERESAVDLMEQILETSEYKGSPSDWVQRDDVIQISHASNVLETRATVDRSMELCYTLLGFIVKSASPEELADRILKHLPRENYQELLDELEKRKTLPEPVGKLKVMASEGETEFVGRFNSHYLLDAFRAMTGDSVKMRYKIIDDRVNQHPVLLEDTTDNIHVIMPMRVE